MSAKKTTATAATPAGGTTATTPAAGAKPVKNRKGGSQAKPAASRPGRKGK